MPSLIFIAVASHHIREFYETPELGKLEYANQLQMKSQLFQSWLDMNSTIIWIAQPKVKTTGVQSRYFVKQELVRNQHT